MPNKTNIDKPGPRLRVIFAESFAEAEGWLGREPIMEAFGVSESQASGDIQTLLEINPGALRYHTSSKTYQWVPGSKKMITHTLSTEMIKKYI